MKDSRHKPRLDDLLLAFRRKIRDGLREEGVESELTFSQIEILHFIGPTGTETMKSISDHLKVKSPTATALVQEMEKKGVVVRRVGSPDRRVVHVTFSKKAKKIFDSVCKRKDLILERMVAKLSTKDRKELERIINIIIN